MLLAISHPSTRFFFDVKAYGAKANGMTDDSKVQDENFCLEFHPEHFLQIQFA